MRGNTMAIWQPPRGRCRLLICDLENYIQDETKYVLHIKRSAFKKSYKQKCQVGNELLVLQGTQPINEQLRGIFIIDGFRTTAASSMIFAHKILQSEA